MDRPARGTRGVKGTYHPCRYQALLRSKTDNGKGVVPLTLGAALLTSDASVLELPLVMRSIFITIVDATQLGWFANPPGIYVPNGCEVRLPS